MWRAISFTNLDEIIWFSTSDIRKIVSTLLFNFLFIPANWNSYSKSDTALNPLKIRFDLYFLQSSVVSELNLITLILFFENFKSWYRALYHDLKFSKNKIKVIKFNSLTTELCRKYKSNLILRGLRAVSDFEYEFQLAGMNRKLNNKVETIFLMSDVENQIISSRFVKEIALHKGDLKKFTTKSTIKSLKEVYA